MGDRGNAESHGQARIKSQIKKLRITKLDYCPRIGKREITCAQNASLTGEKKTRMNMVQLKGRVYKLVYL